MSTIEVAAKRFYAVRLHQRETKAALRAYRAEHGQCRQYGNDEAYRESCFDRPSSTFAEWCAVCRGSQPLWQEYRSAAAAAGAALRALMLAVATEETRGLSTSPAPHMLYTGPQLLYVEALLARHRALLEGEVRMQ